jgi:Spy/CpxP family protein refolding chaperone
MKLVFRTGLAAALLGVSLVGFAQHHAPGLDAPIAMLAQAKAQLNLNTSQQQRWDAIAAQAKAGHEAARANFAQVKAAMDAELAKTEPDLAAVAATADSMRQRGEASHKATRDAWLALYATFTPEQKLVVRDTLKAGIEAMASHRRMHRPPATG